MTTKSYITDGTNTHEFILQNLAIKMSVPSDNMQIFDTPNYQTDVVVFDKTVHKEVSVSVLFVSDDTSTAATKLFNFLNFSRVNSNTELTLKLYLDGGSTVKTWKGKVPAEATATIVSKRPNDILATFRFILIGSSW